MSWIAKSSALAVRTVAHPSKWNPVQSCDDDDACMNALRQGTRLTRVADSRAILSAVSQVHVPLSRIMSVRFARFLTYMRVSKREGLHVACFTL